MVTSPKKYLWMLPLTAAIACGSGQKPAQEEQSTQTQPVLDSRPVGPNAGEARFKSLTQLTFGGENAEAYFNADGTELIFQATREGFQCDQIFRMGVDGSNKRLVSTGLGRTTCSFIWPGKDKITYSSSHAASVTCPPKPDHSQGYAWPLLKDLEIYVAGPNGEDPQPIAAFDGYDAEAVFSPAGDRIVFTSTRSGDIDIWSMKPDGSDLKQLTNDIGYDGGPFFSPDGSKIVYRSFHPTDAADIEEYKSILAKNLVKPNTMNLMVMNADGTGKREVLSNGAANFAPYWHPDNQRIIFTSNMDAPGTRNFDLFLIGEDGKGLERVTYEDTFDGFPMFSYDGKKLVFASNRHGSKDGETNVFIAEWNESAPEVAQKTTALDPERWLKNATTLSAPEFKGRGLGTAELERSADWLAKKFAEAGLQPLGDSYFQEFDATTESKIKSAKMSIDDTVVATDAFQPLAFSSSGTVEGDAHFVGYGISSAAHDYDDYGGVDVSEKIAIAFRYEPQRKGSDKFDGDKPIRESDLRFKAINARHQGAKALILINPPPLGNERDEAYAFSGVPSEVGIPVIHLTWKSGQKLFGKQLESWRQSIDKGLKPNSKAIDKKVKITVELERKTAKVRNVVGVLEAEGATEFVIVGAHYDHLGMGGEGSRAPDAKTPHLGADDNASGVALMVELAHALKNTDRKRSIYFVGFTAEESGLLGSNYFVSNPPYGKHKPVAMVNFDMVGRLVDNNLLVFGTGTAREFTSMLRRAQTASDLEMVFNADGYGASDHLSFYVQSIPVLAFFTGLHDDYHRPSDTADKLNANGAVHVGEVAYSVLYELVLGGPVTFQRVRSMGTGDSGGSGERGYGPSFGSIPAFGKSGVVGVAVSGARPGSAADKAGLKAGDVIVKFGEFELTNLQDFAFALRQHKAGQEVEVIVERDGKRVTLKATLGEAKPRK